MCTHFPYEQTLLGSQSVALADPLFPSRPPLSLNISGATYVTARSNEGRDATDHRRRSTGMDKKSGTCDQTRWMLPKTHTTRQSFPSLVHSRTTLIFLFFFSIISVLSTRGIVVPGWRIQGIGWPPCRFTLRSAGTFPRTTANTEYNALTLRIFSTLVWRDMRLGSWAPGHRRTCWIGHVWIGLIQRTYFRALSQRQHDLHYPMFIQQSTVINMRRQRFVSFWYFLKEVYYSAI